MYSDKDHNYVYLREEVNCPGRGMKKTSEELKIFFISIWVVTVRVHAYRTHQAVCSRFVYFAVSLNKNVELRKERDLATSWNMVEYDT